MFDDPERKLEKIGFQVVDWTTWFFFGHVYLYGGNHPFEAAARETGPVEIEVDEVGAEPVVPKVFQ